VQSDLPSLNKLLVRLAVARTSPLVAPLTSIENATSTQESHTRLADGTHMVRCVTALRENKMGAGASSIPETLSKEQCQEIVGQAFSEELWAKHSKDGVITKDELAQLATVKSVVIVTALESSGVAGVVTFEQTFISNPTKITYKITGLTPGLHGFHM
jgi:hypothetical protein